VIVSSPSRTEDLKRLLEEYVSLFPAEVSDAEALSTLIGCRQEIIDEIAALDKTLALQRQIIADAPELRDLVERIAAGDEELMRRAGAMQDELRTALVRAGRSLSAVRGYRPCIARVPTIVDTQV
jgi:hypothetical protein